MKNEVFTTWSDEDSKVEAFSKYGEAIESAGVLNRSKASHGSFKDITSKLSAREPYSRHDYEYFRSEEAIPTEPKDIIKVCQSAYENIGLVHNIIDLMGDFACQGIRLIHPNSKIERFYKNWFKKVNGKDRSERFLNMFYRLGNVIIKRNTAKIKVRQFDKLSRTKAEPDIEIPEDIKFSSKEIPWRYTIYNPLILEIIAPELIFLTGKTKYALKIDLNTLKTIKRASSNKEIAELLKDLPKDLAGKLRSGARLIPLSEDKISSFFYKKDDGDAWAKPMIYSILKDLMLLEKLKLADVSALDGALRKVRVWKLGDLDAKILPSSVAVDTLSSILANNVGGGTVDIIWGPDIELIETDTNVQTFLGSEKYAATLNSIYAGLGVPPTLTGSATSSGFTNNFISLKTLVERLEYGRMALKDFWEKEISIVQESMGFRFPAQIQFTHMTLSDETAEKTLYLQLADRDLISFESILERFGESAELEKLRMKRDKMARKNNSLPSKAGPWHDAEKDFGLKKIFAQRGSVTPSEIGLELLPRKKGEVNPQEQLMEMKKKMTGQPQQGRPKNKKDEEKRKQRTVKPRTSADYINALFWANNAREAISEIITTAWLDMHGKKNVRSLTDKEFQEMEQVKFGVLCNLELFDDIDEKKIQEVLPHSFIPEAAQACYDQIYNEFVLNIDKKPTVNNLREIQSAAFALYKVTNEQE